MAAKATRDDFLRLIQDDDSRYYRKGETLGKGSYGEVFKVTNLRDNKLMACKLQKVTTRDQDWSRKRELNVWRQACAGTKYVAKVYDASMNTRKGEIRIYTELLEGGDLFHFIRSIQSYKIPKRIHPAIVYLISLQLAWGLSEIQERGILHRDIKLDNILLTLKITPQMNLALWELSDTRTLSPNMESQLNAFLQLLFQKNDRLVVLTDFGLSRVENDQANRSLYSMAPDAQWTVGTSAPELFFHNHQSPMADVYSIGVAMFTLCSFQGAPQGAAPFPPIPSIYSPDLQKTIDQCLSWDPRMRPSSNTVTTALYDLRVAELQKMNAFIIKHRNFQSYKADFDREQARRKQTADEARQRDHAAKRAREQEHARWTALLEEQKRRAAQTAQGPGARPGATITKQQRAAYLGATNANARNPNPNPNNPNADADEAWRAYLAAGQRYKEAASSRFAEPMRTTAATAVPQPQPPRQRRGTITTTGPPLGTTTYYVPDATAVPPGRSGYPTNMNMTATAVPQQQQQQRPRRGSVSTHHQPHHLPHHHPQQQPARVMAAPEVPVAVPRRPRMAEPLPAVHRTEYRR